MGSRENKDKTIRKSNRLWTQGLKTMWTWTESFYPTALNTNKWTKLWLVLSIRTCHNHRWWNRWKQKTRPFNYNQTLAQVTGTKQRKTYHTFLQQGKPKTLVSQLTSTVVTDVPVSWVTNACISAVDLIATCICSTSKIFVDTVWQCYEDKSTS